jgi:hypothetical protein
VPTPFCLSSALVVPPHRSSELWEDADFSHHDHDQAQDLDLALFNDSNTAWGAHVAVVVGDTLLHLCAEEGRPAFWSWDEFAARPRYEHLIGLVRVPSAASGPDSKKALPFRAGNGEGVSRGRGSHRRQHHGLRGEERRQRPGGDRYPAPQSCSASPRAVIGVFVTIALAVIYVATMAALARRWRFIQTAGTTLLVCGLPVSYVAVISIA